MSLKPTRRSLDATAPLILGMLLVACTTAPEQLEAPTPAMLVTVRNLAPHPCNEMTAMVLDGLGVPPDRIRSITYDRRVTGTKNILQGYDAWVQMRDQSGDLVVRQNRSCRFFTSYKQG